MCYGPDDVNILQEVDDKTYLYKRWEFIQGLQDNASKASMDIRGEVIHE